MPRPQSHERPYHHGDLRRVIVKAALESCVKPKYLEFSLRELAAARASVTTPPTSTLPTSVTFWPPSRGRVRNADEAHGE